MSLKTRHSTLQVAAHLPTFQTFNVLAEKLLRYFVVKRATAISGRSAPYPTKAEGVSFLVGFL